MGSKLILCLVIFSSYNLTSAVPLGWYETPQGSLIHGVAVDSSGERYSLNNQFFSSGSFDMMNKEVGLFESRYPNVQFNTQDFKYLELARDCGINAENSNVNATQLKNYNKFIERFFVERSMLSEFMMTLQPYHLLLPKSDNVSTVLQIDNDDITRFEFNLSGYCFDQNYNILESKTLDNIIIERPK